MVDRLPQGLARGLVAPSLGLRQGAVELGARDLAGSPLEASGFHDARARGKLEAKLSALELIEQVDERERGAADCNR